MMMDGMMFDWPAKAISSIMKVGDASGLAPLNLPEAFFAGRRPSQPPPSDAVCHFETIMSRDVSPADVGQRFQTFRQLASSAVDKPSPPAVMPPDVGKTAFSEPFVPVAAPAVRPVSAEPMRIAGDAPEAVPVAVPFAPAPVATDASVSEKPAPVAAPVAASAVRPVSAQPVRAAGDAPEAVPVAVPFAPAPVATDAPVSEKPAPVAAPAAVPDVRPVSAEPVRVAGDAPEAVPVAESSAAQAGSRIRAPLPQPGVVSGSEAPPTVRPPNRAESPESVSVTISAAPVVASQGAEPAATVAPEIATVSAAAARTEAIVEVVDKMVEAIVGQIVVTSSLANGDGSVRIRLKPTVLGGSEIAMTAKEGTLSVTIVPATPEAERLALTALPHLEVALAEHVSTFRHVAVAVMQKKGKANENA